MKEVNVILIGGGIMSATLAALLHELQPELTIAIFERLSDVALESSSAWNNAGTGHSAFCELNYTPKRADGTISLDKPASIAESFEITKEFLAYLIKNKRLTAPHEFINSVPHMSWVEGKENVAFLRMKQQTMSKHPLFHGMEYSESFSELSDWVPLMTEGRKKDTVYAATRMALGTDVNFEALTRSIFAYLKKREQVQINTNHEVTTLKRKSQGWKVAVTNRETGEKQIWAAPFVFIGAGGAAITLLEKSGVTEGKKYGGFPVNGSFLICTNEEIIKRHHAKVYGMPSIGAPPMSVPHLDTRIINGKKELLFGPFAGFSTKFLKQGSYLDLFLSLRTANIFPMLSAGIQNIPLTEYLIKQILLTPEQRLTSLHDFFPKAELQDWRLHTAGQRVQIIKHVPGKGGVLKFGTEVISTADGSLAALLGASPGASTSIPIMLELLMKNFQEKVKSDAWQKKLKEMIPSYGKSMATDRKLCNEIRSYTNDLLQLKPITKTHKKTAQAASPEYSWNI